MSSRRAAAQRASQTFQSQLDSDSDDDKGPSKSASKRGRGPRQRAQTNESPTKRSSSQAARKRSGSNPDGAKRAKPSSKPFKRPLDTSRSPSPSHQNPFASTSQVELSGRASSSGSTVVDGAWQVPNVGEHVFVRVALQYDLLQGKSVAEDEDTQRVWWPGKITRTTGESASVTLVGHCAPGETPHITIQKPHEDSLLPFLLPDGQPRFETPRTVPRLNESPRKRQKTTELSSVLLEGWKDAVREVKEDIEDDDDLPDAKLVSKGLLSKSSRTRLAAAFLEPPELTPKKPKVVHEPDYKLTIPGELVLAREYEGKSACYWPAKVTGFSETTGKYHVTYLDEKEKNIPRDWFFAQLDDGLATCKLGDSEPVVRRHPLDFELDADDTLDAELRVPSPEPRDAPPTTVGFNQLPLREKFGYIKPVLKAILRDEYGPTRSVNATFMAGGNARRGITQQASDTGMLDARDVELLAKFIQEWCLRTSSQSLNPQQTPEGVVAQDEYKGWDEERGTSPIRSSPGPPPPLSTVPSFLSELETPPLTQETMAIDFLLMPDLEENVAILDPLPSLPTRSPPQAGSEAYEKLAQNEKLSYCMDVLLQEAKIQLLLWMNGTRASATVLSDDEELDLHLKGEELLGQRDFVCLLLEWRSVARRRQGLQDEGEPPSGVQIGGTASRPKRSDR